MQHLQNNVAHRCTLKYSIIMNLSFTLDTTLISLLKQLDNEFAIAYHDLKSLSQDERDGLHRYAKISMIGSSTRIENALLTDIEISWLDTILTEDGKPSALQENRDIIENKLSKDRERSIEEVAGCRAMLMLIYQNPTDFIPLRESDIRFLHFELLSPYQKAITYAGQYKTQSNSVVEVNHTTGKTKTVFQTADAGPITSAAMRDLVEWYNLNLPQAPWPITVTAEFIYRFLAIHPFQDGNGRLGRGLFLLSLLQSQSETISYVSRYLAIDRYIEKNKEEYYYVLNKCSNGTFKQNPMDYQIQLFLKFMIKIIKESIAGIDVAKQKFSAERGLHESAAHVLNCFKNHPEIRLTTHTIVQETRLPRRTVIYAINTLLELNLIQKYGRQQSARYQLTF
ncbi:MAG: Fic family protein [Alphaproteobacteria bacterium]|nr:Fic family protein [Alphaproteobacteria bacterium]